MTIIIGRGRSKATQRIEITDPSVSREHCWLTDNGDGTYTLENKSQLGTFVEGRQIIKTRVTADTIIKLGPNTSVKVSDLLPVSQPVQGGNAAGVNTPQGPSKEYSIRHLDSVWNEYHQNMLKLQEKQRNLNLLIRVPTIFTIGGGVLAAIVPTDFRPVAIIMSVIALAVMVYGFYKSMNFNFAVEKDKLDRKFQDHYVCPNPMCHHYLGFTPYNILRQDKYCRYCRCKLTEL